MELTRRDALAALGAAGLSVSGALAWSAFEDGGDPPGDAHEVRTLVAVARVVYPSEVANVAEFVETYTVERLAARPSYAEGVRTAVDDLDEETRAWYDEHFVKLDHDERDQFLRGLNVDTADPDPGGDVAERVRHYLVNDVLFALYSTPTGGALIGNENPPGHPGGLASYRRGPDA